MHIHHNPIASGNYAIHSAGAAEKAAAAQRAAETRRKLMKSAAQIDGALDAEELFMIGKWSDDSAEHRENDPRPQQQIIQTEDEISAEEPISVWA